MNMKKKEEVILGVEKDEENNLTYLSSPGRDHGVLIYNLLILRLKKLRFIKGD